MTIELVIFDLDGVLVDACDIHKQALNDALVEFGLEPISNEDHKNKYDGLTTNQKLTKLNVFGAQKIQVHNRKQEYTTQRFEKIEEDWAVTEAFRRLKTRNIQVAVVSNSIKTTVRKAIEKLKIEVPHHLVIGNEDGIPKPNPSLHLLAMSRAGVSPNNTLILEDGKYGIEAAERSGANVQNVDNSPGGKIPNWGVDELFERIDWYNNRGIPAVNILIPMAGEGSRFRDAGYAFPKPLVEVHDTPMIKAVSDNLGAESNKIFIVRSEHYRNYDLRNTLGPDNQIVFCDGLTEGAACTTLLAEHLIDNNKPLVIANSDQLVHWQRGFEDFLSFGMRSGNDAIIATFKSSHPKWSYCRGQEINGGLVYEVREKQVISNMATCGIYFWRRGSDYVKYAKQMIEKDIRTNGEFYVAPVFNEAIADGKVVRSYEVSKMHGLGTPEDLQEYLRCTS